MYTVNRTVDNAGSKELQIYARRLKEYITNKFGEDDITLEHLDEFDVVVAESITEPTSPIALQEYQTDADLVNLMVIDDHQIALEIHSEHVDYHYEHLANEHFGDGVVNEFPYVMIATYEGLSAEAMEAEIETFLNTHPVPDIQIRLQPELYIEGEPL